MTKYPTVSLLALACLAGCPTDDEPKNDPTLWIAPDGAETRIRLVPKEPAPF